MNELKNKEPFRFALEKIEYGLYIVASHQDGKLNGQISDALIQVTNTPERVAVSINKTELTHDYIMASRVFSVSVLSQSAPLSLIGRFGFKSGREIDKLSEVRHFVGDTGAPIILENTVAAFECKLTDTVDVGTHTLFIGNVVAGHTVSNEKPMAYLWYQTELRGRVPKNSPSYQGEAKNDGNAPSADPVAQSSGSNAPSEKYICDVCSYVYDPAVGDPDSGIQPGTAFDDLPDDWLCPICGVDKTHFTVVSD